MLKGVFGKSCWPVPDKVDNNRISNVSFQARHFSKKGPKMKAKRYPKDTFGKDGGQDPRLKGRIGFPKHFEKSYHFSHHGPKGWARQCLRECLGNLVGLSQARWIIIEFLMCLFKEGIFPRRAPR